HTVDGTIVYDPKDKVVYLGDTIYAVLKNDKASRDPNKALKLIKADSKLDAAYYVIFHDGIMKKETMDRYFNTVKTAIKLSLVLTNWEEAKAYYIKKYKQEPSDSIKRIYDSVLNV